MKKRSRTEKPEKQLYSVPVTAELKKKCQAAARREGKTLTDWASDVIEDWARKMMAQRTA